MVREPRKIVDAAVIVVAAWLLAAACNRPPLGGTTEGKTIFLGICSRCHGQDGHGDPTARAQLGVPDMNDPAWQAKHTEADIRYIVRHGSKSKKMPAFSSFTEAQAAGVAHYVKSRFGPK